MRFAGIPAREGTHEAPGIDLNFEWITPCLHFLKGNWPLLVLPCMISGLKLTVLALCRHLSSMAFDESKRTALSMPALPPHSRDTTASPAPPRTATRGNVLLQSSKRSSSLSATSAYG